MDIEKPQRSKKFYGAAFAAAYWIGDHLIMGNPIQTRAKEPSLYDQMSPEDRLRYDAWEKGMENGVTPDNPDRYMRYRDYVENGLSQGMTIDDALRLSELSLPPTVDRYLLNKDFWQNIDHIRLPEGMDANDLSELIDNVEKYAPTLSNNAKKPAVAGVYDAKTGEYYYAKNNTYGEPPNPLNKDLKTFLDSMPEDVKLAHQEKKGGYGSHAEIYAVNDALNAGANLEDLVVYVMHTEKWNYGKVMPRCEHCQWILQNLSYVVSG